MGCWLSTSKPSGPQHSMEGAQPPESDATHVRGSNSRAPPPSMEEETVKEVLSETPTPKPKLAAIDPPTPKPKLAAIDPPTLKPRTEVKEEKKAPEPEPVFQMIEEKAEKKKAMVTVTEEISEVSEVYSVSESVSTTITERRDDDERSRDDGEVRQRIDRSPAKFPRNRSFSGELSGKRDRVVGRSPVKRSEPSPVKRSGRDGSQTTARRGYGNDGHRRESGESSGRRSRSPAMRNDGGATRSTVGGRVPSARRNTQSPSRVPVVQQPESRDEEKEGKWPPANESLENPLVSLECFIFL